jgi:hypothetical protein
MNIPRKVKIGLYTYKVKNVNEIKDGINNQCWGLCDHDTHTIFLKKGMKEPRRSEVFLHECIHGIEESYGIALGETKVNQLGLALMSFFKENKLWSKKK